MNKPPDTRKALGKGLSALLPSKPAPQAAAPAGLMRLPIEQIAANPTQPRTAFHPGHLQELADSIKEHGVIQPLIVRRLADQKYELVAGERRWRASRLAGLAEVPVVIQDIAQDRLLEVALIENIQREDLNAIETALAFERLAKEFGLSHDEIGRRTGKDRSTITNLVRLLKLPQDIQLMVAENRLSMGHARALLALPSEELQRSAAEKAVAQGLSVRNVERLVQRMLEPREAEDDPAEKQLDPNTRAAIEELEMALGTRVRILPSGPNRGKIEIDYFSQDDLDRIYLRIVHES